MSKMSTRVKLVNTCLKSCSGKFSTTKWTYAEKQQLYKALTKYGSSNIKKLADFVPTKSETAIKLFIQHCEKFARHSLKTTNAGKVRDAPVDKWLEILTQKTSSVGKNFKMVYHPEFSRWCVDVSTAVKFIALFEPQTDCCRTKLSECYKLLAACLKGDAPQHLNRESSLFILETLQSIIDYLLAHGNIEERKVMRSLPKQNFIKSYKSKLKVESGNQTETNTLSCIIANPLQIPDGYLLRK